MPSALAGYFACLIAVVFFGTNFVPVKRVAIGDGVFFQVGLYLMIPYDNLIFIIFFYFKVYNVQCDFHHIAPHLRDSKFPPVSCKIWD